MRNNSLDLTNRLMTPEEAGAYLGLKARTMVVKARKGQIPFVRLGGGLRAPIRFRRADLDRWLSEQSESRRQRNAS